MPRNYPEVAELAASVTRARAMLTEASADPANLAALKLRGVDELRQDRVFVSREEVKNGLLAVGAVAIAAEINGTKMIGGAISPSGESLDVRTFSESVATRYDLPIGEFSPVGDLLLNLAALAENSQLPPMTNEEADIRNHVMASIEKLGDLKLELAKRGRDFFSLEVWRYSETVGITMFWLNPVSQTENNFGWFSLPELRQWLDGQGPIVKYPPLKSPKFP